MARPGRAKSVSQNSTPIAQLEVKPPKTRRSPTLMVLAVLLIVLAVLGGLFAFNALNDAHDVVAVRNSVSRGQTIKADDLMSVKVGVDPALKTVPAAQLSSLVGKVASSDLSAGTLVAPNQVGDVVVPGKDQSVVGLSLPAGTVPSGMLRPGDNVRIIAAPNGAAGQPAAGAKTQAVKGMVVSVESDPVTPGAIMLNVQVATEEASQVAAAAAGKAIVVLDSRVR